MPSLQDVYIGCTVFSAGITVLDFLGILGHHEDGDASGSHHDGHVDSGHVDVGHADAGDVGVDMEGGDTGDIDASVDGAHDDIGSETDATHTGHGGVAVLSVLSYLRSLVYFCLGFGPTGWVAMSTGRGPLVSLAWALPAGAVAFVLARAFFRFQRHDTDSSLSIEDLLLQRGIVTVPLTDTKMGKVRIQVGMNVTEQYALAAQPGMAFHRGDAVRVANVTEECLHVEDELTTKE